MLRHCIYCHRALSSNDELDEFPVGRRIAYDPDRGRLWVICTACSRWTLAPFEQRWEALEALERRVTERAPGRKARLLASTDEIALFEVGGVEIVRVGSAPLAEEAWWRYGREFTSRWRTGRRLRYADRAANVVLLMAGGFWLPGGLLSPAARGLRYGRTAWRGTVRCQVCGSTIERLGFTKARRAWLEPDADARVAAVLPCGVCRYTPGGGEWRFEGASGEHLLRRALAHRHFAGAPESTVRKATRYIEDIGTPGEALRVIAAGRQPLERVLADHNRTQAVAMEIALNDVTERDLLRMQLDDLERRWREEEELASIIDRELTPVPGWPTFHRPE